MIVRQLVTVAGRPYGTFATITIIAFFLISCTTTPTETTKPMDKVIDKLKIIVIPTP